MSNRSTIRRVIAFVLLLVLLLVAFTPGAAGLALAFMVFTAWFLVGVALVFLLLCADEDGHALQVRIPGQGGPDSEMIPVSIPT